MAQTNGAVVNGKKKVAEKKLPELRSELGQGVDLLTTST